LSYWFSPITLALCSPVPPQGQEPNPYYWLIKPAIFSQKPLVEGAGSQYRFTGYITIPSQTTINIVINIAVLDQLDGKNYWKSLTTINKTLNMSGPYGKNVGLNYGNSVDKFDITGIGYDVKKFTMVAGIEPLINYCKEECSMWNNDNYVMCFRAIATDLDNIYYQRAYVFAQNSSTCGQVGFSYCGCDTCTPNSPFDMNCVFNADPAFYNDILFIGVPGEAVGVKQEIQIGWTQGAATDIPIKMLVKSINGNRYFCFKRDTDANWTIGTEANLIQDHSPTIYRVTNSNTRVDFIVTLYPNLGIMPDCGDTYIKEPVVYGANMIIDGNTGEPIGPEQPEPKTELDIAVNKMNSHVNDLRRQIFANSKGGCGCRKKPEGN
jgi:hypothetical protein